MDSSTETGFENSDNSYEWPKNSNSFEEIPTVSDHNASSPVTPKSDSIPVAFNFDHGSSDVSPNHDSDGSSYSELDSEAEAFYSSLNYHLVSPGAMDTHDLAAEEHMSYEELMKKCFQYEEELRTTSLKLQESELEIDKLKGDNEKRESAVLLSENLRAELETAQREIERKEIELDTEKRRVLDLQRQVVDLETTLSDSSFKFENLVKELKVSKECVDLSGADISQLKEMLCDCQQSFSAEKTSLQTEIAGLLANQTSLEALAKKTESRCEVLENQIRRSETEQMEMLSKEVALQAEINVLKTDLASRNEHIEELNKDFDKHKLTYDMLMAEKDGVNAELDNSKAAMRSKDIQIELTKKELNELLNRHAELVSESRIAKNNMEELRSIVKELMKKAKLQSNVITDVEEEKREAIRQLCFSLDHYKSGYRQLLRLFSSINKRQDATMVV